MTEFGSNFPIYKKIFFPFQGGRYVCMCTNFIYYTYMYKCVLMGVFVVCLKPTHLTRIDLSVPSILDYSAGCVIAVLSYSQTCYLP